MNRTIARIVLGALTLPAALLGTSARADDAVVFDITRFDVVGNSQLAPADIDAALTGFTGKRRDFTTLQQAMDALERSYHDRGFKLTTVRLAEQELKQGVVRLDVVETKIGKVIVSGNQQFDEANIRRSLPVLVPGTPPNMDAVSASLKRANEHPSKKLTLKLSSGDTENVVDAMVDVAETRPWGVSFDLDNAGQPQTGETNARLGFQHNNVLGLDHALSLQFATTLEKPSQVLVYGGSYRIPFYDSGDLVELYGNYSDVDSGSVQSGLLKFGITGKGTAWGARYNKRLGSHKDSEARLSVGLDVKHFKSAVLLAGADFGSEIVVRPLSLTFTNQWDVSKGQLNASVSFNQNIAGASNGGPEDFAKNRLNATDSFRLLRYSLAYSQPFDSGSQVRLVLNGQHTNDALISGEQFGAGGASSVRGFAERVAANDVGATLNAEWYSPNFCTLGSGMNCLVVAFYDTAYLQRNKALPGELNDSVISSLGLGMRFSLGTASALQFDWGHVVRSPDAGSQDSNRLHVRASLSY